LGILFFAGGFLTAWLVSRNSPERHPVPVVRHEEGRKEISLAPPVGRIPEPPLSASPPRPRVAIVIDDIGVRGEPVEKLLSLGIPITFAVMPGQPHTKDLAEKIRAAGFEVLLHMPMEPEDYRQNPGEEALLVSQTDGEIRDLIRRALAEVPQAVGLNNHMGSLFTKNEAKMRVVMDEMRHGGLFFLDSLTTPKSVGLPLARQMGVKSAARRIFLDNEGEQITVEMAIRNSIRLAKETGGVIAIGHPHPATIASISAMKEEFAKEGVELVAVSAMVR